MASSHPLLWMLQKAVMISNFEFKFVEPFPVCNWRVSLSLRVQAVAAPWSALKRARWALVLLHGSVSCFAWWRSQAPSFAMLSPKMSEECSFCFPTNGRRPRVRWGLLGVDIILEWCLLILVFLCSLLLALYLNRSHGCRWMVTQSAHFSCSTPGTVFPGRVQIIQLLYCVVLSRAEERLFFFLSTWTCKLYRCRPENGCDKRMQLNSWMTHSLCSGNYWVTLLQSRHKKVR